MVPFSVILNHNPDFSKCTPPLDVKWVIKYCRKVWYRKLKWCGYPTVKKFEHMIARFDTIRTDRHRTMAYVSRSNKIVNDARL